MSIVAYSIQCVLSVDLSVIINPLKISTKESGVETLEKLSAPDNDFDVAILINYKVNWTRKM